MATKQKDPKLCPKCTHPHDSPPTKPTLCHICQDETNKKKADANKRRANELSSKREPIMTPTTLNEIVKTRTFKPGDVFTCDQTGWLFFPGDNLNIKQIFTMCKSAELFCDWGGVASLFLEPEKGVYEANPQKIQCKGKALIFSYTPIKLVNELEKMRVTSAAAGFYGMVITTQKGVDDEGKSIDNQNGKHQLLTKILELWDGPIPEYHEDTGAVLDNLANQKTGFRIKKFWVMPKNEQFRKMTPEHPDIFWFEQEEFLERIL